MAKKSKRSRKASSASSRRAVTSSTSTQAAAPAAPEPKQSTQELFAVEYHYVLSDLKRFAALAVGMFALLIALALIIG